MNKLAWVGLVVLLVAGSVRGQQGAEPADGVGAPSKGPEVDPALQRFLAGRRDAQGRRCQLRAIASVDALKHLACGEAGVWTVRTSRASTPQLIEQRVTTGSATGFFVRDGVLWVETLSVLAQRLFPVDARVSIASELGAEPLQPAQLPAASEPPPAPSDSGLQPYAADAAAELSPYYAPSPVAPPAPVAAPPRLPIGGAGQFEARDAHAIGIEPGHVIVDLGSENGVRAGEHIAFDRLMSQRIDDEHAVKRRERVAVGRAAAISERRARVELGFGERVPIGAQAYPTTAPLTARSFAPPRLGGLWHAAFIARPFLVVDNLGAGLMLDGRAGYRFESPFHLEALLQPLAVATGRQGAFGMFAATLNASYDSRLFEAGLGVGGQTMNDPAFDLEAGTGTTVAQRVRLGSADGGMLEIFTYIVLFHSEFEFSDVRVHGQLPVGDGSWLLLNAGGGSLGIGFGEVGLKVLMHGNGDRGSYFLTVLIGGAHAFKESFCVELESNCNEIEYNGPLAGVGVDWRF